MLLRHRLIFIQPQIHTPTHQNNIILVLNVQKHVHVILFIVYVQVDLEKSISAVGQFGLTGTSKKNAVNTQSNYQITS